MNRRHAHFGDLLQHRKRRLSGGFQQT